MAKHKKSIDELYAIRKKAIKEQKEAIIKQKEAIIKQKENESNLIISITDTLTKNTNCVLNSLVDDLKKQAKKANVSIIDTCNNCSKDNIKKSVYNGFNIDSSSDIWDKIPNNQDIHKIRIKTSPNYENKIVYEYVLFYLSSLKKLIEENELEIGFLNIVDDELEHNISFYVFATLPTYAEEEYTKQSIFTKTFSKK